MSELARGHLTPRDGVKGCSFRITKMKGDAVQIVIQSPFENKEILAQKIVPLEEVGQFLVDHQDY